MTLPPCRLRRLIQIHPAYVFRTYIITPIYTTELSCRRTKQVQNLTIYPDLKFLPKNLLLNFTKQGSTYASSALYNELVLPKSRRERALEKIPCNTNLSLAVSVPEMLRLL